MGRRPINGVAMTPAQRVVRWREAHRLRLWPDEDAYKAEIDAWSGLPAPRPQPSKVIHLDRVSGRVKA
jgi:hypothetical protein